MKPAKGTQGSWFATAKTGEYLPCLKARYIGRGGMYHEPKAYDVTHGKGREYLEAIQNGRVLMARYDNHVEGETEKRTGYNGYIYVVEDVRCDETGLYCRLVRTEKL